MLPDSEQVDLCTRTNFTIFTIFIITHLSWGRDSLVGTWRSFLLSVCVKAPQGLRARFWLWPLQLLCSGESWTRTFVWWQAGQHPTRLSGSIEWMSHDLLWCRMSLIPPHQKHKKGVCPLIIEFQDARLIRELTIFPIVKHQTQLEKECWVTYCYHVALWCFDYRVHEVFHQHVPLCIDMVRKRLRVLVSSMKLWGNGPQVQFDRPVTKIEVVSLKLPELKRVTLWSKNQDLR